jgi:hypothetical protein
MTATDGGPAVHGADTAATARQHGHSLVSERARVSRLATVLSLARVEASLLTRSMLVLTGLLAGGATVWGLIGRAEPLWWNVAWKIGFGQLVLGVAVLFAAHLAAGRPRRDSLADLYASFPATARTRMVAQLTGLVGALPASLVLIAAAVAIVESRGAIGTPSATVLAGGVLLVIAAGAIGIAIAARFPHPLAGVLGALVLLLSSGTSHAASGGAIWLLPWEWTQDQLSSLPGPLAGYPPGGAHALELAGIAVLAVTVALAATAGRARTGLAMTGIVAVAAICVAGAAQLRPVPTADLNHLVTEIADPPAGQRCTTVNQVRYCLYPGFGKDLPSLEAAVSGVLAHLPARPPRQLAIMQSISISPDTTFTHGHSAEQVSRWTAALQRAPGNTSKASAIYLSVGSWPAGGGQLADARFQVALAAADWAVHLPFPVNNGAVCVSVNQARNSVAIWLAMVATHSSPGEFSSGLRGPGGGPAYQQVGNTIVPAWNYPGTGAPYLNGVLPQFTAAGYELANAMMSLPPHKVISVLGSAWTTWLSSHTTEAQLARALGIRMPSVAAPAAEKSATASQGPVSAPQSPACTT